MNLGFQEWQKCSIVIVLDLCIYSWCREIYSASCEYTSGH